MDRPSVRLRYRLVGGAVKNIDHNDVERAVIEAFPRTQDVECDQAGAQAGWVCRVKPEEGTTVASMDSEKLDVKGRPDPCARKINSYTVQLTKLLDEVTRLKLDNDDIRKLSLIVTALKGRGTYRSKATAVEGALEDYYDYDVGTLYEE